MHNIWFYSYEPSCTGFVLHDQSVQMYIWRHAILAAAMHSATWGMPWYVGFIATPQNNRASGILQKPTCIWKLLPDICSANIWCWNASHIRSNFIRWIQTKSNIICTRFFVVRVLCLAVVIRFIWSIYQFSAGLLLEYWSYRKIASV